MIKGIFFDLGGTLYSYRHVGRTTVSILRDLAERMQLEHEVEEVIEQYRLANQDMDRLYAKKPFYLFRDYFEDIFENFLNRLTRTDTREHFPWFEEQQRVKLMGSMELKPDAHQTLTQLKAKGLYLSVVSNADENMLHPLIERAELHRWLDHWTSSEAARSCKPDQRFFEIALEKSGLSPQEVLFVGDSLEQDIHGAHEAGMKTVLITEADLSAPMHIGRETADPDFRISALSTLPGIVDELCRISLR